MNNLPQTRDEIASLIPHQGGMCLLEQVIACDDTTIHCISSTHRDPALPLREQGQLTAVHLCEYGAQATAIHGALLARAHQSRAPAGLLVALRDVTLHCAWVDDQIDMLHIHATQRHASSAGCSYEFRVLADDGTSPLFLTLATGTATVAYLQE